MSNHSLLYAAKCQVYSINRFWVIKGKPKGGKNTPTSPRVIYVNQQGQPMLIYGGSKTSRSSHPGKSFQKEGF